jgi:ParB-like chromosome segregation protein Spo0J
MKIIQTKINDLKPYKNNPRKHTEEQIAQIAKSIDEFGFLNPILVDEKNIILAGHGRYMASQTLNLDSVPVVKAENLTDEQKQALVIADNKIASNSTWDENLLWDQIRELNEKGFDLNVLAFEEMEILPILNVGQVVDDPSTEWVDMPDYQQENLMPQKTLLVHFANEDDRQEFAKLVNQKLTEKTKFIWYPPQPEFTTKDRQYESD